MIILEIVKAILHYALGLRLPLRLPKRKKNPTDSRFYPIHRPYNTIRLITGTANAIERELNVSRISYITLAFARVLLVFSSRFAPLGHVLLMLGRVLLALGRVLLVFFSRWVKSMTFSGHVQKVLLQGRVSQIFSSCSSLNFIKFSAM